MTLWNTPICQLTIGEVAKLYIQVISAVLIAGGLALAAVGLYHYILMKRRK